MSCKPSTSNSPEATQASATSPTKPPHGYPIRSPRQSWSLEEEPHSDTAVDDTAAGTSEPLAALPKDNDDNGSEYTASSSDEDPVPAKRCRESARLRGVRAPTPHLSRSPFSEGRGRKRSRSQNEESVPERTPYGRPGVLKRPTKSNVRSHLTDFLRIYNLAYPPAQPRTQVSDTGPTYKSTNRANGKADGVERPGTPSGGIHANVVKRLRQYNRTFSARPPRKRAASSHSMTTSESDAPAGSRTPPKPQVTTKPPDDGSAAVKQFLSGIGLAQSHLQILLEEGIRTQQDLDGLRRMEKECMVELRDVLRARGFTAFEFSKVEYAVSRREN